MNDAFVLFHQVAKPETVGPSASIYVLWRVSVPRSYILLRFTSPQARTERKGGGGGCTLAHPPNPNLKKLRFSRYGNITWFTLQPKSATEIGWWLVQSNFEKKTKSLDVSDKIKNRKKIRLCDLNYVSHETCSYMHINAVVHNLTLLVYLRHGFTIYFLKSNIKYT
jgi:hypothetical protein